MRPSIPYVLPFALFLLLLAVMPSLPLGPRADQLTRLVLVGGALLLVSRQVLDFRVRHAAGSVLLGVLVFAIWIAPDLLIPGWRELPLFSNRLTSATGGGFPVEARGDPVAVGLRFLRAAALVPVIEELFWRAWLPRWIVNPSFQKVPLGTYTAAAFWITAVLFALEHGAWWDVGLVAGILYNWWMRRTRSLGDCIAAHAVTNGCLSAYVVAAGKWEYW
jgi:uncharacterized protein